MSRENWARLQELAKRGPIGLAPSAFQASYGDLVKHLPTLADYRGLVAKMLAMPPPRARATTPKTWTRERMAAALATASRPLPTRAEKVVAFHEAGHAVVAHRLGVAFGSVNALQHEAGRGMLRCDLSATEPGKAIAILRAGKLAQQKASLDDDGDRQDRQDIAVALGRVHASRREAVRDAAERDARGILSDHWQAVERVANALLDKSTLNAADVRRLVDAG